MKILSIILEAMGMKRKSTKKKRLKFDDINKGDVFAEKFDPNITPYCEPIILTIQSLNYDDESFVTVSNFGTVTITKFKALVTQYDRTKKAE